MEMPNTPPDALGPELTQSRAQKRIPQICDDVRMTGEQQFDYFRTEIRLSSGVFEYNTDHDVINDVHKHLRCLVIIRSRLDEKKNQFHQYANNQQSGISNNFFLFLKSNYAMKRVNFIILGLNNLLHLCLRMMNYYLAQVLRRLKYPNS